MKTPDFSNRRLVAKYGSWMKVQVAFYDFLFTTATQMHPGCFNKSIQRDVAAGKWADGQSAYDVTIATIEQVFPRDRQAWEAFLESEQDSP